MTWINDLKGDNGCFLPHIVQDQCGFPIVDQTLHWANPPATDCMHGMPDKTDCATDRTDAYEGPVPMTVHVHGAHVDGSSDGYPEAWWLANFAGAGSGDFQTRGSFFYLGNNVNGYVCHYSFVMLSFLASTVSICSSL